MNEDVVIYVYKRLDLSTICSSSVGGHDTFGFSCALVFNRDAQQGNSLRHSVIESFHHSTHSTNH